MFLVRTNLGPSSIHGLGAFALEPIREGQVVWNFDSRFDVRFPLSELSSLPPAIQECLRTRGSVEMRQGEKIVVLCPDNSQFINHSTTPNLLDIEDGQKEVALRDIAVGEELTCDYYTFDLAVHEKLDETLTEV